MRAVLSRRPRLVSLGVTERGGCDGFAAAAPALTELGDEMPRCRLVPVLVPRVVRGVQQQARQAHARSGRLLLVRRNRQHGAEERVARLAAPRVGQAGAPPCVARPVRWAGGMLAPPPPLGIRARDAWLQLSRLVAATAHA